LVHPQQGAIIFYPFGQEKIIIGAARLALKLTAPAVVNVVATIDFEE
jgi:hypothetical protein